MSIPHNPANAVNYKEPISPYLPACILSGLVVYPLAVAFALPLLFLSNAIYELAYPEARYLQEPSATMAYRAVAVSLGFLCCGYAVGLLQKHLVMRYFKVSLSRWRVVSMIGACVAGWIILYTYENRDCLLATMRDPLGDYYYSYYSFMLSFIYAPMIQFAFVMSAFQTASLYPLVRMTWLWIAANAFAGVLFFWLYAYTLGSVTPVSLVVAAVVQSLVVGYAMRFLLTQRRRGGKAKRDEISIS